MQFLKEFVGTILILIFGIALMIGTLSLMNFDIQHVNVIYDCRLAEISPDFPPHVKELCRKKINENLFK